MEVKKEVVLVLRLSEEEATWLSAMTQNPINCEPEDETHAERIIRERFFTATSPIRSS